MGTYTREVLCDVEYTQEEDENGIIRDCVVVTCSECGHETMSWGHSKASVRRCLALLKEECPMGDANFYVEG